jgi:filamentous hemagglutinin family protein
MEVTPMLQASIRVHSRRLQRRKVFTPITIALSFALPGSAYAAGPLPSGGHFVAGTGSISGNSTSLTINQSSNRGVINWNSFSIGSGNHVSIMNGTGATLNRVTGGNLSSILGTLSATGSVYLINPQGILIGRNGIVSTGGRFVASTLDADNTSFMNGGPLTLSGSYTSTHSIVNLGKISSSHSDVFLISNGSLVNGGTISAPNGTAELVVGGEVLLHDSSTSQQVFVLVPFSTPGSAVVNRGTIDAAQISLLADGNIYALAGNHAVLRATGTAMRDGHVWLVTGRGNMTIDSTIEARNANGSGGTVDMVADNFSIGGNSNVKPFVKANQWNITASKLALGGSSAAVFQRSLNRGTSIKVQTTGIYGVDASGDIDVASSIQWFGPASLTLDAHHSLTIGAAAKLKNTGSGNLTLRADSAAIDNGGSVTNNGTVDWSASKGIVSAFYDMNGSYTPGKLLANTSWTSPSSSGLATQITGYKLVNSFADLEKVSNDLAGNYALGKDIDASATSNGSYVPIGSDATPFMGQFDGEGHTIDSLTLYAVSQSNPAYLGLFGTLGASSVVRNLNINGSTEIAGFVATDPPDILPSQGDEGILAAHNYGTIVRVNTSGNANQGGVGDLTRAGGLVGVNYGTIERSSSSVDGTTSGTWGGLVGENHGVIAQSYATGSGGGQEESPTHGVGSEPYAGGLVGVNDGLITQSYATGAVGAICYFGSCGVGGLVNINNGVISQSFATGALTVENNSGFGQPLYPGGIASANTGSIKNDVYWNKETTGVTAGVGTGNPVSDTNGLTTAQMTNPANFSGWDFSSAGAWALPPGYSHPILRWQLQPPVIN